MTEKSQKNASLPTHWKMKMATQVKHTVTIGLGLGIATALGYHFLSTPKNEAEVHHTKQMTPLHAFNIAPAPSAVTEPVPVPVQPQLDNHFQVEAQPLELSNMQSLPPMEPTTSYEELVSAMQPVSSVPVEPVQETVESENSYDAFSVDLDSPNTDDSSDFVFDGAEEFESQASAETTDQVLSFDDTLADTSTSTAVDHPLPEVVDFNSNSIDRSSATTLNPTDAKNPAGAKASSWKANPFINNSSSPTTVTAVEPASPMLDSDLEMPTDNDFVFQDAPVPTIQDASPLSENSVLSLNDPESEGIDIAQQTNSIPSAAVPTERRSYQRSAQTSDQEQALLTAPVQHIAVSSADAQKAVHHIEYGKTLSRRGAAFTARQEFLAAMQVLAAGNDRVTGDNRHSKALKMAMLTIREAGDFTVANSDQQIQMDVASVVETHRSNVLTVDQAGHLSPVQAMNQYFAKAQQYLDLAGGRNVVSAEVFYCMGKLHTLLSRNQKVLGPYETAKSVVYHQVALLSDDQHHRSANELGVLLARNGRLEQSKLLFERSLLAQPTVRTWQNLAQTHWRLGEQDFARKAVAESKLLASGQSQVIDSSIQWKPVEQFNADAPTEFNQQRVAQLPNLSTKPVPASSQKPKIGKSIAEKIKGIF